MVTLEHLSRLEFEALLAAGLIVQSGRTLLTKSYSLTPAGRILLQHQLDADNFPTQQSTRHA